MEWSDLCSCVVRALPLPSLVALPVAATLVAAPGWASEESSMDDTNSPTRLPAVIVTAQKKPSELEALPVSVTPVTSDTIRDADITSVKQAEICWLFIESRGWK